MVRRASLIAIGGIIASVALVFAGIASPAAKKSAAAPASVSCSIPIQIGMEGPFTGPAASIGDDQLHWALYAANVWNASHSPKISIVQGDTQLNPAISSTVSQSFASNSSIVGVLGPAGSQEVLASSAILKKAGLAFISGSATNPALSDGKLRGYFFRVVPNDSVQGPTDANYMMSHLGVKKGDTVMIVDDEESYSTGLATIVKATLTKAGVKVDSESISQKDTDFSALIGKVGSDKVVFTPFQLASQTQLLAQQLKAQGKKAVVFASDGSFDTSKYNASGNYVSFFAADVTTIAADKAVVAGYHKQFPGGTSPFGAPNYVATQLYAMAAAQACKSGKGTLTRASLRAALAKQKIAKSILGTPMAFTANGDVSGAAFHIFKIVDGKKYVTVS
ncbi:MAG TPA: branched-chain amino acid ABC transporter substrate-binding protein [Gaiellaceae bacterium]|jgi:branched-chain amino acid transport system substrate-binding protein